VLLKILSVKKDLIMSVRVFLESNDSFTVSDNDISVFGSSASETIRISSGISNVQLDANFENIKLAGNLSDYQLVVVSGIGVQIQTTAGAVVMTVPSLNQAATVAFADGSSALTQTGGSSFALGGQSIALSTTTASTFTEESLGSEFDSSDLSGLTGGIGSVATTTSGSSTIFH